jgi:hypothetical protein
MDALNASAQAKGKESAEALVSQEAKASAGQAGASLAEFGALGRWLLLLAAITLVCVIVRRDIGRGEFDYNVDEGEHAVTGLFMADTLRDMPLRHPVEYAYAYYAQYPGVAVFHWPPLFHVIEGLSFLLLGPSAVSARLTVILFAILLLYQWFRLVEELQDSYTAGISTAVLGLVPMVVLFEKTVMLEVPSLALGVATVRCWIRYVDRGQKTDLYRTALWLSAALLCKQTSVYLLVFCALTLLVTRKWERIWRREALQAAGLVTALAGPFLLLMLLLQGKAMASDLGSHRLVGMERLTYSLRVLPASFSPGLLVLAVLGLLFARRSSRQGQTAIMVCWLVAGYLTLAFFGQRDPRFGIYLFPPLVYVAVGLMTQFFRVPRLRLAMRGIAVALVALLALPAWNQQRPYISGYESVAAKLVNTYHSGIVLFDGNVPGNFVFYMRALDPKRHFLVLRKALYAHDIRSSERSEELLHSREELTDLFRRDGIRFVVVSKNMPVHFNVQRILREQLQSDQFQLLGSFPIASNEADWKGESLLVYENKQWSPPADKVLTVRMLTLPHDIVVPMQKFAFEQQ